MSQVFAFVRVSSRDALASPPRGTAGMVPQTDTFESHAKWLQSLRADYNQRVSEASQDAGEPEEAELDGSWLDGALGEVAATEGVAAVYIGGEFEEPVYRSIGSLAVAVPADDVDVHYEPPAHCCSETGRQSWRMEPSVSARALEAEWLSENPPLLCRQRANSDVALNRAPAAVDPFHPLRSA